MDYADLYELYAEAKSANYNHATRIGALKITMLEELPIVAAALTSIGAPLGTQVAGVYIGLPSVEIYNQGMQAREILISVTDDQTDPGQGLQQTRYGTLWSNDGGGMAILGGKVEIMPLEGYAARTGWTP
jgi:hypothetical protein